MSVVPVSCAKCSNSEMKTDHRMCTVKHIDCAVRGELAFCSSYSPLEKPVETKRYQVTMRATATLEIDATSALNASKIARWQDADVDDWEVTEVKQI